MSQTVSEQGATTQKTEGLLGYLLLGILFGIVLTKSDVISWFRIQEMFRFQAFHMYGIIGAAVVVAAVALALIKTFNVKTVRGDDINIPPSSDGRRLSLLDRRDGLRARLGAGGCVPRSAVCPHQQRHSSGGGRAGKRRGGHVGLRRSPTPAAALAVGQVHDFESRRGQVCPEQFCLVCSVKPRYVVRVIRHSVEGGRPLDFGFR